MDRLFQERLPRLISRRPSQTLQCNRCGQPVKTKKDQDVFEEILCPTCASDARISDFLEDE